MRTTRSGGRTTDAERNTRNLPNESTAILDNMQKLDGIISRRSMLDLAEKAGYIGSVDEEEARLQAEAGQEPAMTGSEDISAYGR